VEDDLRREYSSSVFYANDAFGGLHIMEDLVSANGAREKRLAEGRVIKEFAKAAAASDQPGTATEIVERSPVVGDALSIPKPPFYGVRVTRDFDLREVFQYINETALFKNQWQLKTASQQDYVRLVEEKFRPVLKQLEDEVIASGIFEPRAVYGYFPAQAEGNDVIVYDPESVFADPKSGERPGAAVSAQAGKSQQPKELLRFTFPRQKDGRQLCIADFFARRCSGKIDVLGLSLVTIGSKASEQTRKLFESGEYTRYLYLHGLGVETAEALA
jgi:5-methyltetrahydrofolate--homocysteine methyltransferase